jgi:outer membrane receptor protein involved in Fe transport
MTDLAALGISQAPEAYNSDNVWSYELGAKGRPVRSVQFEASAFRIDWSDIQNSVGLPSCGFGYIANLGTARIEGFDARVSINPLLGLTLEASLAHTDARYSSSVLGAPLGNGQQGIIVAKGDRLNVAPWSMNLAGDYEFPLSGDDLQGYVHADYDYRSGFRFGNPATIGYDPIDDRRESSHFVSARMGIRRGDLDVSAFVRNLLNSTDVLSRTHDTIGSDLVRDVTFRPRTFGLTASMRY